MQKNPIRIVTKTPIDAEAATVWRILSDFASYPHWNPFIRQANGPAAAGERVRFHFALPSRLKVPARAVITCCEPDRELRWTGHILSPLVMRADHFFILEPVRPGRVMLVHGEHLGGAMAAVLLAGLGWHLRQAYQGMNLALKHRAEQEAHDKAPLNDI